MRDMHPRRGFLILAPDVHRRQGSAPISKQVLGFRGSHLLGGASLDVEGREHRDDRLLRHVVVLARLIPELGRHTMCRRELGEVDVHELILSGGMSPHH